jgi:putative hydrolase of the HAD superfamily
MSSVHAVLLDLYDTIARVPGAVLARERLAREAGVDPARLQHAWAHTLPARSVGSAPSLEAELDEILRLCGAEPEQGLIDELAALEWAMWSDAVELFDDSLPFMARTREDGRKVAIVSNCSRQTRSVVRANGLEDAADAVVLSFEVGVAKPDPGIFRVALERLGVAPEHAIFVDDVPEYLNGARAVGIRTVQIVRAGLDTSIPDGHPRISELAELEPFLRG